MKGVLEKIYMGEIIEGRNNMEQKSGYEKK